MNVLDAVTAKRYTAFGFVTHRYYSTDGDLAAECAAINVFNSSTNFG
jgi:hypothetical protein